MMKKRIVFCLITVLCLPLLLTACREGGTWSFSLSEGLQVETLDDKALAYMTKNYGDIFEKSDTASYSTGSVESHDYHIFVKVKGHPYDNISIIDPADDKEKGEMFLTVYPHYLFGNTAGAEWEKMLKNAFSEMGYLAPKWEWITKEEIDDGTEVENVRGTWAEPLDGLTKDSTLEEYMDASPIYGVLVLPEKGHLPIVSLQNENLDEYMIESDDYLSEFEAIDPKYDIVLFIIFLENDYFDELKVKGNPAVQFLEEYAYGGGIDEPVEYAQRYPSRVLSEFSYNDLARTFSDDRIKAVAKYTREEGQVARVIRNWNGPIQ